MKRYVHKSSALGIDAERSADVLQIGCDENTLPCSVVLCVECGDSARLLQWQKEEASKTQPDSSYFREQIREGFLLDC